MLIKRTTEADILDGQRIDIEMYKEIIKNENSKILIFNDNHGNLIGCVNVEKQANEICYIGMLTVFPTSQGSGFGSKILNAAESFAKKWGCSIAKMTVIDMRITLIDFYIKRGYRNTGLTEPFPTETKFGIPKVEGLKFCILLKDL